MKIQEIINTFGIPVTYLNPSKIESNSSKSKMGGSESFIIDEIDKCEYCKTKMTLIIELFRDEFKDAYFPNDKNYLQVKTCYNEECPYDENRDIEFKIGFGKLNELKNNVEIIETHIPEIYFEVKSNFEIPYNTYETALHLELIKSIGQDEYENRIENHVAKIGTKLNGDIFAWNEIEIPICNCGNKMNQILQISSYEPCLHPDENRPYYAWESSIGVYIAQLGNYHFFTCKTCNNGSIEYRWDSQ